METCPVQVIMRYCQILLFFVLKIKITLFLSGIRYFVTYPCLVLTILVTVFIMLFCFRIQEYFSHATQNNLLPGKTHVVSLEPNKIHLKISYFLLLAIFGLTNFLPKVVYANIIEALNAFYKNLCYWLNDKGK